MINLKKMLGYINFKSLCLHGLWVRFPPGVFEFSIALWPMNDIRRHICAHLVAIAYICPPMSYIALQPGLYITVYTPNRGYT